MVRCEPRSMPSSREAESELKFWLQSRFPWPLTDFTGMVIHTKALRPLQRRTGLDSLRIRSTPSAMQWPDIAGISCCSTMCMHAPACCAALWQHALVHDSVSMGPIFEASWHEVVDRMRCALQRIREAEMGTALHPSRLVQILASKIRNSKRKKPTRRSKPGTAQHATLEAELRSLIHRNPPSLCPVCQR